MTIAKTACRNAALKASKVDDESLLVAQSAASTLETPESAAFIDDEEALQDLRCNIFVRKDYHNLYLWKKLYHYLSPFIHLACSSRVISF